MPSNGKFMSGVKLGIIHKGLFIVLLPLAVNCLWIAMLDRSLESSRRLADMERTQSNLLLHVDNSFVTSGEAFGWLFSYTTTGDIKAKNAYLKDVKVLKEELAAFKSIDGSGEGLSFFSEVLRSADIELATVQKIGVPSTLETFQDSFEKFRRFRKFLALVLRSNQQMKQYVETQRVELERVRASQDAARQKTRAVVLAGLLANFILSITLSVFFVNDITKRLKQLVQSATKLPRYQPLNQRLKGDDELVELDQALHQASTELSKAKEYRSSLMQMMAHDLRSPLAAMQISLQVLSKRDGDKLSESGSKQLKSMNSSVERLIALINDLLLLEQLESSALPLDAGPENINEVCQTAVESVEGLTVLRDISIVNDSSKEYVVCDRERIMQVVVNFLSNAIKHSPEQGTVRIVSDIGERAAGKFLRVSIEDSGQGLTESEIAKLFEKFHQLKEGVKAGGSGLGLAISKLIVQAHGGEVGVESSQGKGSKFWFLLPIDAEPSYNKQVEKE